uniref:39S ribosomal protein L41, mitochondrial n=1 Tax=Anopheles dirus TaxID=7168 RepID=A0A182NQZ7_9DIPT
MFHIIKRGISTTTSLAGKKNFRKFLLYNKRGTRIFKQQRAADPDLYPDMPIDKRGVRDTGVTIDGKFIEIAEKIPELVVPNLEGCKFKPYVSYKAPDVVQSEFTSQDLFNAVYAQKIINDWKTGDGLRELLDDFEVLLLPLLLLLDELVVDEELELLEDRR